MRSSTRCLMPTRLSLCLLLSLLMAGCSSQRKARTPPPEPEFIESFKGQSRVVVVFTPAKDDRHADQLARIKARKPEWRQHDFMLLEVVEGEPIRLMGQKMFTPKGGEVRDALKARQGAFAVVLVGLDGEEKLRSAEPISVEALFEADEVGSSTSAASP